MYEGNLAEIIDESNRVQWYMDKIPDHSKPSITHQMYAHRDRFTAP